MEWFPQWLLDLAKASNAIILSANYRLLPEATGLDIINDVEDLWKWLSTSLPDILERQLDPPIMADFDRILVSGESAGGLLSIILALKYPKKIRAAIACYPIIDMAAFGRGIDKPILGNTFSRDAIDRLVAEATTESIISTDFNQTRLLAMLSCLQHGALDSLYSRGIWQAEQRIQLYPLEKLKNQDVEYPSGGITIIHGTKDSVVSPKGSQDFLEIVQKMTEIRNNGPAVSLSLQDGEHYFDTDVRLEESWLQRSLARCREHWLQ